MDPLQSPITFSREAQVERLESTAARMAMPEVENRPMKLRRLVAAVGITLAISLLSVFLAGVVVVVVDQARMTYATPETQSPFLRSATLTPVLNRFSSTKYSWER